MNLGTIANYCWNNRVTVPFGSTEEWEEKTFLKGWFCQKRPNVWIGGSDRPGWYWFELKLPLSEITSIQKPSDLSERSCDFGGTATQNHRLFGRDVCQKKSQLAVVYNGHEANVLSRIRAHFAVDNKFTGALGIKKYGLSWAKWRISFFLRQHIDNEIDAQDREKIVSICNSKTGRIAIEQLWRSKYGWPLFCKV
ncbi:MAG: hypothetical protein HQM09_21965 [Candidatus Riflebacteria bacterium]|nr:hypothetical protein [Candidatus Riflebacteria bacterium]